MTTALVTGAAGQDGHYLTRLLLAKGYRVIGLVRRAAAVPDAAKEVIWFEGDLTLDATVDELFSRFEFDEIYNLAGPSFGPDSWDHPADAGLILGVAVVRLLEAIPRSGRPIRLFQASSSELFGQARESPQHELTPFQPVTPYGFAKRYAHEMCALYRERFGMFVCNGILFNHESPYRRPEFVTRKVTLQAAKIALGIESTLALGDLETRRDWGFAGDVADAMWRMLQAERPEDFVVATGESHTVRELCSIAFEAAGLDYRDYVVHDQHLVRSDAFDRRGDPARIKARLGWTPSLSFRALIGMMVDADIRRLRERPEQSLR